jgi:hypothetical protein
MSTLSIPLQKKAFPRFKEIIFLSQEDDPTSNASSCNSEQNGASHGNTSIGCLIAMIVLLVVIIEIFFVWLPFFMAEFDPASAPFLLFPMILSLVFSIFSLRGVVLRGEGFCVPRVGHLLFFGNLCLSLFYIAEWLKLWNFFPFEWSIICIPVYVGCGFLLVALIWFLVLCLGSSFEKGDRTSVDVETIICGIDSRKVPNN